MLIRIINPNQINLKKNRRKFVKNNTIYPIVITAEWQKDLGKIMKLNSVDKSKFYIPHNVVYTGKEKYREQVTE